MKKRKYKSNCLMIIIMLPIALILKIFEYAANYKPMPLIGSKPGRKKKNLF